MTVYNENRDGKWEIVKNDATENYTVTYYERYDACGWKQIGEAESYSKECAEYEFDINLDETVKEEKEMKKFEVGAMYWDTSAVDHNDVMVIKITRRTEKSVWFVRVHNGKEDGEPSRTKIFTDATREYVMPYKYSMAPVWTADRKVDAAAETTAPEADAVTPDEPETETATPDAPANDKPAPQQTATEAEAQDGAKFEVGKTYKNGGRLITIVKRTLRTVTYRYETRSGDAKTYRGGVQRSLGGGEYICDSFGCPVYAFSTVEEPAPQPEAPDAAQEPETANDNKTAAMTAQEAAARKMIAEQTTGYLLNTWEGTTDNNDPFIPTVRGWLMDELQARYPEAYDKWLDSETCEDAALREYIEAAEQAGQPATNGQEEKKMTLKQLFIETHMEFAKEEIDGVMVYTGGGEYCEPFGDVAEVLNRYGDREIEPIYLGGDYPASMTEPDAHGMIHVALVEPQQAAQDSAEAEAARWKETVRRIGERLNAFADADDNEYKGLMFGEIRRIIKKAEQSGVALEAEYDADGRFVDVRERTETADDGAAAGQPAPQAEAAPAVRTTRKPAAPYDLFQFHAESGTYLFQNEGEAALIDALEFHADAENALSVVRALYEITHDGGGWSSPRNHPVMLNALNAYIEFLTEEIEVFGNFQNATEKEIAVGKLAEAKVIRDAFAADVARAAA